MEFDEEQEDTFNRAAAGAGIAGLMGLGVAAPYLTHGAAAHLDISPWRERGMEPFPQSMADEILRQAKWTPPPAALEESAGHDLRRIVREEVENILRGR